MSPLPQVLLKQGTSLLHPTPSPPSHPHRSPRHSQSGSQVSSELHTHPGFHVAMTTGVGVASAPEKTRKNKRYVARPSTGWGGAVVTCCRALKAVRSLSALTSRGRGAGRVTFGSPVSITDRSPKASATDERGHNQNTPTASEYLGGVALVEEPESSGTTAEETVGGVALEPLGDGEEEEEEEEEGMCLQVCALCKCVPGSGSDGAADDESTLQTPPTANQAPSTPDHQELRRLASVPCRPE